MPHDGLTDFFITSMVSKYGDQLQNCPNASYIGAGLELGLANEFYGRLGLVQGSTTKSTGHWHMSGSLTGSTAPRARSNSPQTSALRLSVEVYCS